MSVYHHTNDKRIRAAWQGRFAGLDAFYCCPGPSLKLVNPNGLRMPGAIVAAINTAYPHVRPDVWFGMDSPTSYNPLLWSEPFLKLIGSKYEQSRVGGASIRASRSVAFVTGRVIRPWEMFDHLEGDVQAYWPELYPNTFITGLHLLFWLGVRNVYLLGCDFGGQADYYDSRVLPDAQRNWNRNLYHEIVNDLPLLRLAAESSGHRIVSCTADSPANEYLQYLPIDAAVSEVAASLPSPNAACLTREQEASCQWSATADGDGIITGCDANTEWTLPWFMGNLRKHYAGPVAVMDFGMTAAGRAGLPADVRVIPVANPIPGASNWFCKPAAMLASPFMRTVWLDTDCKVLGDLMPLFAECDRGVSMAEDPFLKPYNTGVVAYQHGNAVIRAWAERVHVDGPCYRGDQELFDAIARLHRDEIAVLGPKWNWLRLRGEPVEGQAVYHLTGPTGKNTIRWELAGLKSHRAEVLCSLFDQNAALVGAEIGVLAGKTSRLLLSTCPSLTLYMVDRWSEVAGEDDLAGLSNPVSAASMERLYQISLASTEFAADRRRVLRGNSIAMSEQVADKSLDFVFIDANHSYHGCRGDIAAWARKVKPGGIIAGHDYEHPDFPTWGVKAAVEEYLAAHPGVALNVAPDYVWWVRKPDAELTPAEFEQHLQSDKAMFDYADFYREVAARPDVTVCVELGCWKGHSTAYLAGLLKDKPGASLHAVDLFENTPKMWDTPDRPYVRQLYEANLRAAGVDGFVKTLASDTADAAKLFADESVDFVWVDAGHDAESVLRDVTAWLPKVRPGGLIAGHDANLQSVRRGLDMAFGLSDAKPTYEGNRWLMPVPVLAEAVANG